MSTGTNPSARQDAHRSRRNVNDEAGLEGDPTPRAVRVGKLDTVQAIRVEMGRVYRAARRVVGANPSPSDATKLGWLLNAMATAVISTELAERVAALEERGRR